MSLLGLYPEPDILEKGHFIEEVQDLKGPRDPPSNDLMNGKSRNIRSIENDLP